MKNNKYIINSAVISEKIMLFVTAILFLKMFS